MTIKEASVTQDRDKYIGGSDIPIIFGISPFKTRWQLILEKAEPNGEGFREPITSPEIEFGNDMEPIIRDYINRENFVDFQPTVKIVDDLRGNVDGLFDDTILEIKTTSKIHDRLDDYKMYLLQVLFYMDLYDLPKGMLAIYKRPDDLSLELDPEELQIFYVYKDKYADLLDEIRFKIEQFRDDVERVRNNPLLTEEDLQPKEIIEMAKNTLEIANQYEEFKAIESYFKEVKENLKLAMQKAGIKRWIMNDGTKITLIDDGSDSIVDKFDESAFKKENKEVYAKYCVPTVKKGRAGYVKITLPKEK